MLREARELLIDAALNLLPGGRLQHVMQMTVARQVIVVYAERLKTARLRDGVDGSVR